MPVYEIEVGGRIFEVDSPSPPTADIVRRLMPQSTPMPDASTRGMLPNSTLDQRPVVPTTGENIRNTLQWGGKVIAGMTGMGSAGVDAVENPKTALTVAALGAAVPAAVRAWPTKAKAAGQFQQVMGKVGSDPVDVGQAGNAALRISELAERGASMPKVVRDLIKRATDPEKGEITYKEARDFYSNISRLSADEYQRLNPVVKMEVGKLRVALDRALAKTAANGGEEATYRAAMKQYALASRINELATKAAKYSAGAAAGALGASAAYNVLK